MTERHVQANPAQSALWNARGGGVWVEQQALLDRLFLPFERLLADAVSASGARNVLDIGCGAGATTIAVARRLAGQGRCTGLDISTPLIEAARRRVEGIENARFVVGDAQNHPLAPASFDGIISRFGVMFFDDPVAAFANLRRAVGTGAGLRVIAWRGPDENPFMTTAERAAAPFLPALEPRDPSAPGQFAFADAGRVKDILAAGGWRGVDIQPIDVACTLSAADLDTYIARMGRVGLLLPDLDEATRETVVTTLRSAFAPYVSEGAAHFNAACWRVSAWAA